MNLPELTEERLAEIEERCAKLAQLWPDPVNWGLAEQDRYLLAQELRAQREHAARLAAELAQLQPADEPLYVEATP